MNKFVIAAIFTLFVGSIHVFFHIQLISLFLAPLIFSVWLSFTEEPPEWLLILLVVCTELFANTPPGAMTLALVLPLLVRNAFAGISSRISTRFFVIVFAIVTVQVAILTLFLAYEYKTFAIAWPTYALVTGATSIVAFFVSGLWHELTATYERT